MIPTFLSMVLPEVVVMTITSIASGNKVGIVTILGYQWVYLMKYANRSVVFRLIIIILLSWILRDYLPIFFSVVPLAPWPSCGCQAIVPFSDGIPVSMSLWYCNSIWMKIFFLFLVFFLQSYCMQWCCYITFIQALTDVIFLYEICLCGLYSEVTELTHWGRVTHVCVKLTIIGLDNGLLPGRRQAIIWTNAGISLIGPSGTNFSEILIEIHTFSFEKMHLKMSSRKWWWFCLGLIVLICTWLSCVKVLAWGYSVL